MTSRTKTLIGFAVAAVVLGLVPNVVDVLDAPGFYLTFMFTMFFWISQSSSWNILTGYSGYFSFGQGAWFGIGVYATGILASKHGWPFLIALPVAGLVAGAAGLLLGLVVFRLRRLSGEIFALTTLAVSFVLASVARLTSLIDGGRGIFMTGTPLPEFLGDFRTSMYRMTLVIALLTVLTAYLIFESRLGWGLFSIRDDEEVARGLGVPTFRYKMTALGTNAFFGGLMGGVWALQIGFLTVEDIFNIRVPLLVILMAVLGGMRHWMGPVVGAMIIYTLTDRLNSAGLADLNQVIIGALLIVLVLGVREGIYLRISARWIASAVIFFGAMAVLTVFDLTSSLIWDFSYALLVTMVMLLIPTPLWERLTQRRIAEPPGDPPPELPVPSGKAGT
ncbi:MAG: branched-chain amino acid ABC transporter permease [Acidimicrobiia bacterium]